MITKEVNAATSVRRRHHVYPLRSIRRSCPLPSLVLPTSDIQPHEECLQPIGMAEHHQQSRNPDAAVLQNRMQNMRMVTGEFCEAFVAGMAPATMLTRFFASTPKITEHGPAFAKARLPFLVTPFRGRREGGANRIGNGHTCDDYYDLLSSILSFHPHPHTIPPKESFLVACTQDADGEWQGGVTVKLHASFSSINTGRSWSENLVYVLSEFDDELKIGHLEIWADPLSAWMAVGE